MARRGFSCPNCHTWFEGEGNHPSCPLCGTRASPRDLLDSRHRPAEPLRDERWDLAMPGHERAPAEEAPDYSASPYFEEAPDLESGPDYDMPAPSPNEAENYAPPRNGGGFNLDWTAVAGVLIFLAIVASRVCGALAG